MSSACLTQCFGSPTTGEAVCDESWTKTADRGVAQEKRPRSSDENPGTPALICLFPSDVPVLVLHVFAILSVVELGSHLYVEWYSGRVTLFTVWTLQETRGAAPRGHAEPAPL